MITPKLAPITPPAEEVAGIIRERVVVQVGGETGGITQDAADARYMPINPASGTGFLRRLASGAWNILAPWFARWSGQSLPASAWMKIGTINASGPTLLDINLTMIRTNTGKRSPSQYRLSISVNQDGGNANYCYFGAQLICLYGDDYDGTNDDPLQAIALVRPVGAGPYIADLLLKRDGTSYRLAVRADPEAPIQWTTPVDVADPGTTDRVTTALRRILVAT